MPPKKRLLPPSLEEKKRLIRRNTGQIEQLRKSFEGGIPSQRQHRLYNKKLTEGFRAMEMEPNIRRTPPIKKEAGRLPRSHRRPARGANGEADHRARGADWRTRTAEGQTNLWRSIQQYYVWTAGLLSTQIKKFISLFSSDSIQSLPHQRPIP